MKKIGELLERSFNPVRIDLDDFYEIIALLKTRYSQLKITANRFELECPEEVEKLHSSAIREITIQSVEPFLLFWFSKGGAHLHVGKDDDLASVGLVSKISQILHRPTLSLVHKVKFWLPFIILGLVSGGIHLVFELPKKHQFGAACTLLALFVSALLIWVMPPSSGAILFNCRKQARQTFFTRNKELMEKIIIGVFSAASGAFVAWLLKK